METYAKLYQRILDSSVWKQPSDIRIVWITLLALKDENGCVFGTEGWLADRARVDDPVCHRALKIFKSPDKRSRTGTNDGRKIEDIEGGWRVLNHHLYRDGMEDMREKWRRQKAKQRSKLYVGPGESIRQVINRSVNNDPITKADQATIKSKGWANKSTTENGLATPTVTAEYDLDDPGDSAP